jgi:hypothetical protein
MSIYYIKLRPVYKSSLKELVCFCSIDSSINMLCLNSISRVVE